MTTHPAPAPPLPPAPPTATKRRGGAWKAGAVGVAGLILGLILGSNIHSASPAAAIPAPTVAAGASAAPVQAAPATQAQEAQPAAPAAPAAGPARSFGDGTFTVPDQIAAGSYQTDGKGDFGSCYWARLKDASGDFNTIITNGNISGPTTVTLRKTDGAFEASGGCTWTKR